jgi:succinylglutamic semialdehyde dehydrogenase
MKTLSFLGDYINGQFVTTKDGDGQWTIHSPADVKDRIIEVHFDHAHVDQACGAAKSAFGPWQHLPLDQRKTYLLSLQKVFQARADEMAEVISRETGKPLWEAKTEAQALSNKITITIEHSYKLVADERIPNALPGVEGVIRHRGRGVMAVVGPFNFPAHLPNGHIVPALLMGNTVVFKPSDKTPAVGQLMAECFHQAGFPPGVFNLLQGQGEMGRRLVTHPLVDGVLFTGSYEVGLKIKQDTLEQYWKILALEMGGKNSTVVWQDADLDKAVYETLVGAFMTTGQRCSCTSKVILHPSIQKEFLDRFHAAAKGLLVGHWSKNVFMGPLINADAVEKYVRFQEIAKREGAECLMRGKPLELEHKGHYVSPSIYLVNELNPDSVYQQSEIFGPNVAVYSTDDFSEALRIVNSGGYGLVMALFSKSKPLFDEAILGARVGLLNWNRTTNGASSRLPFGGIGKSGNDRASGHFAIQYCSVPVASLEDPTLFDPTKKLPGIVLDTP